MVILRECKRRSIITAVVLFTVFVVYWYWDMHLNNTDNGTKRHDSKESGVVFDTRENLNKRHDDIHIISLLDPYKVPDNETINCVPLGSAVNKEVICTYPSKDDNYISTDLNNNQVWESPIVDQVKKLLTDDPRKGLIDIGTNVGIYTITAASMGRTVVGVEPYPPNVERLAKSLRQNSHLLPKIKIVTNAVSNKYEKLRFWNRSKHPGGTKTFSDDDGKARFEDYSDHFSEVKGVTVDTIMMDDLLTVTNFKQAILKIDIEGYEFYAFQNASRLFAEIDISHVFFEWDRKRKNMKQANFFIKFFKNRAYTVHEPLQYKPLIMTWEEACTNWPFDVVWIKSLISNL